jgi:mannose-6-phosphate isomerase-like protein (cupin superfamily)
VQVVAGRVRLVLEAAAVDLGPGDCVVARGTAHRWEQRGDAAATLSRVRWRPGRA